MLVFIVEVRVRAFEINSADDVCEGCGFSLLARFGSEVQRSRPWHVAHARLGPVVKQSYAQHLFDVDLNALRDKSISKQHGNGADTKRMSGYRFGAVWQSAQGPAGAIETLQALEFDES